MEVNDYNDVYTIMDERREIALNSKSNLKYQDTLYFGTMSYESKTKTGTVTLARDVFAEIDTDNQGHTILRFFDENNKTLATRVEGNELVPSKDIDADDFSFLSQFISENESNAISLNELDQIAENVSKSDSLQRAAAKGKDGVGANAKEDKIHLEDEEHQIDNEEASEKQQRQNAEVLKHMNFIGKTPLNQKIDDRHTLGDVLGVEDSGATLVAVYSTAIAENTNSTRYSFLIQHSDGKIEPANMLEQARGTHSDVTAYDAKLDKAPDIEKEHFISSHAINSNSTGENKNYMLLMKRGQYGLPEISLGEVDPTQPNQVLSKELKRENQGSDISEIPVETRNMTRPGSGKYNVTERIDEAQECEKNGHAHTYSTETLDGNINTVTPEHMLEPDVVDQNITQIATSYPSGSHARRLILVNYLNIVRGYMNDGVGSLDQEQVLQEIKDNVDKDMENYHETDEESNEFDDYVPTHKH